MACKTPQWYQRRLNALLQVEPLRNEVTTLNRDAEEKKKEKETKEKEIRTLEESIVRYKEEYAVLMGQVGTIKNDLQAVESKVTRANDLLHNLGSERERWEGSREQFREQMNTIVGE